MLIPTHWMTRICLAIIFAAASTQAVSSTWAGWPFGLPAGWLDKTGFSQTGSTHCCPACDHVCKLTAEDTEVERLCFYVETKVVCIPRVVFPWQRRSQAHGCSVCDGQGCKTCVHNGGRTRRVNVIKPSSYKCPSCEYTWSAEKKTHDGCANVPSSCDQDDVEPQDRISLVPPWQVPREEENSIR